MSPGFARWFGLCGFVASVVGPTAHADNFAAVRYDPGADMLVVTMLYRGTNPNHTFSLQWGRCKVLSGTRAPKQIAAVVLDSQWNDVEQQDFRKTVRFSLASISCRPAEVTLQTAPRFRYTVQIPAAPDPRQ